MYQCSITGITSTVAPKGFMNSKIFIKWLDHFSSNFPGHVKRHIILVYNGCGIHYSMDIVEKAIKLRIILVILPYNSSLLIQTFSLSLYLLLASVLPKFTHNWAVEFQSRSIGKRGIRLFP